jgi:hypothetical protein
MQWNRKAANFIELPAEDDAPAVQPQGAGSAEPVLPHYWPGAAAVSQAERYPLPADLLDRVRQAIAGETTYVTD